MLIEPYDETPGLIGLVTEENIGAFESLLLEDVVAGIREGLPMISLGWMVDDIAVGAISGMVSGDVFQIRSFYVAPKYRNMGGGNFLLESMEGLISYEYRDVSIGFVATNKDADLLGEFLSRRGYSLESTLDDEADIEFSDGDEIVGDSFSETDSRLLKKIAKQTDVRKEPLPEGGLMGPDVDLEISRFYGDETKFLFVAVEKGKDDSLILSSVVNHTNNPIKLLNMLRDVLASARYNYPAQTRVYIPVVAKVSKKLVLKLLPGAKPVTRIYNKHL